MNLQTQLAIKNYKLLERQIELKSEFKDRAVYGSQPNSLITFVIIPLCLGFVAQRLSQTMSGAELLRIATPVASLLLKI